MSPNDNQCIPTAYRPCVGLLVMNQTGNIWIGRRAEAADDAEGRGLWWQMPQGGIDDGEDPERAALRELYEETGITSAEIIAQSHTWYHYDLPAHLIGRAWNGRFRGQKQKWFAIRFIGDDTEIDISPVDHPIEFHEWRWAQKSELLDVIVPFKRDVYAQVLEEFASLIGPVAPKR